MMQFYFKSYLKCKEFYCKMLTKNKRKKNVVFVFFETDDEFNYSMILFNLIGKLCSSEKKNVFVFISLKI